MAARAGSKLVRDLVRRFRPGYTLCSKGSVEAHYVVRDPKGALVRHDDGRPLVLPNSPHARGGRLARLQLELERGGVIDGRRA